ncbi:MAG: SUF system NifU family Fe-S cluster assembly protein [Peptostreptococcaceae bacterium]|nr:SUF system NifU family Fe-S cluster assembly protein [Peptostreptococcaceae bacterium]
MDLNDIYQQIILEHSKSKKNKHTLEDFDMEEPGHNPSCGDEITLQLKLSDDKKAIKDIAFTGVGCAISQASTSIMCDLLRGKSLEEARELCATFIGMIRREITDDDELEKLEDAEALRNISNMPARVKCAVLAWRTLDDMIKDKN